MCGIRDSGMVCAVQIISTTLPGTIFISFLHPNMDIIHMEDIHVPGRGVAGSAVPPGRIPRAPAHQLLDTRQPDN